MSVTNTIQFPPVDSFDLIGPSSSFSDVWLRPGNLVLLHGRRPGLASTCIKFVYILYTQLYMIYIYIYTMRNIYIYIYIYIYDIYMYTYIYIYVCVCVISRSKSLSRAMVEV